MIKNISTKSSRLTERLFLRVSLEDRIEIALAAERAGLTVSSYLRHVALERNVTIQITQQIDPAIRAELNRIGVNLNQMTLAANRGRFVPPEVVEVICAQIEDILRQDLDQ